MTDMPIDQTVYDELKDTTGAAFAAELVNAFLQDAPTMLGELRKALADRDVDRFRRTAHTIKSNANLFGARVLAESARYLELGALDGPDVASFLNRLDREYADAAKVLRGLQNG